MTTERDENAEMRRFPLDDRTADQLLSGQLAPEDAPAGFEEIARLMAAAAAPARGEEPGTAAAMAATIARAMAAAPQSPASGRKPVRSKLTAKVTAIAAVAVLLTGTAAAAATNSLPGPAQSAVSDAASTVGVNVPKHHHHGNPHDATLTAGTSSPGTTGKGNGHNVTSHGKGPDAGPASPATYGLCQSFSTVTTADPQSHSTAYRNLAAAAAAAGKSVSAYCATIKPPAGEATNGTSATGGETETEDNGTDNGTDDNGTEDQKPATTPGKSGTNPGTPSPGGTSPGSSNSNSNSGTGTPQTGSSTSTSTQVVHGPPSTTGKPAGTPGH